MNVRSRLVAISGAVLLAFGGQAAAADVDFQRLLKADKERAEGGVVPRSQPLDAGS
jgi:hypothetical protein